MLSRRHALALCGCAVCVPLLPQSILAEDIPDNDDSFFICGTPQITTIPGVGTIDFGAPGGAQIGDQPTPAGGLTGVDDYATASKALRWTKAKSKLERNGVPLVLIGFVDGTQQQRDEVKDFSQEWLKHNIGLVFDYTDELAKSHVRITFKGGTNQSKTGIEALSIGKSTATMSLPEVLARPNTTASRRAILHEFGHGLMAFGHEHRHPDAGFTFRPAEQVRDMINRLLPPQAKQWTTAMVQQNITDAPYSASRVCTAYDTKSIMHYPIMKEWLLAGTPVPNPATTLSALDIGCATDLYKL